MPELDGLGADVDRLARDLQIPSEVRRQAQRQRAKPLAGPGMAADHRPAAGERDVPAGSMVESAPITPKLRASSAAGRAET